MADVFVYAAAVLLPFAWVLPLVLLRYLCLWVFRRRIYAVMRALDEMPRETRVNLVGLPVITAGAALLGGYGVNIYSGSLGQDSPVVGWLLGLPIMVLSVIAVVWFATNLLGAVEPRRPARRQRKPAPSRRWRQDLVTLEKELSRGVQLDGNTHQELSCRLARLAHAVDLLLGQRWRVQLRIWRPKWWPLAALVAASCLLNVLYGLVMSAVLGYGLTTKRPEVVAAVTGVWPIVAAGLAVTVSAVWIPFIIRGWRRWWLEQLSDEVRDRLGWLRPKLALAAPLLRPASTPAGLRTALQRFWWRVSARA